MENKKAAHTPGPWILSIDEKKVGTISGETRGWGMDHLVTGLSVGANPSGFSEELLANAHLIAACPEMFDLLKRLECCAFSPDGQCIAGKETLKLIMRDLAGIIAKAEGRGES